MRKRQREESNERRRAKKQKTTPPIFQDKEFLLNEADPALTDLLEKNGAQVFLFSYYGGGFQDPIMLQVTSHLNWQQKCYAESGTERYWVKKEYIDACLTKAELLDDKEYISFNSGLFSAAMPWYVELSDKNEQKNVEKTIIDGGGALIKLPFFGKALLISDEDTVKISSNIYNYMRNMKDEEGEDFKPIHSRGLIEKILNEELKVYDVDGSNDTMIEYDSEAVQLALEQFSRYSFRMQRYDIKRSDYSGHNITTLTPDAWHQILSYLPLETILEFATLSKSCHNLVHNTDHFWHQQSQAVKDQWYWAENIELEQIKSNNMTWFEFFKTRVHPLMLDQIWFGKVSRNAESPEDVETASVSFKVNVQMDFKRVDESDIKLGQSQLGGKPHLANSMMWPEGHRFVLQINLEELVSSVSFALHKFPFPKKGIVYYFENCVEDEAKILYYNGPIDHLSLRDEPENGSTLPLFCAVKFFESVSPNMTKLDNNIGSDLFQHRAVRGDRSILGWDMPVRADDSVLTNNGDGDDNEDEDEDDNEDDEEENSEGDDGEKHGQLLLCLHSFDDVKFGDRGAVMFWLPHSEIPEDPEHCDPSQFNFSHQIDD